MKPKEQFKIYNESDIIKHFENYADEFDYSLNLELKDYANGMDYMQRADDGLYMVSRYDHTYKTIQNPYSTKKNDEKEKLVFRKSWSEFRNSGLLFIINQTLHIFGWAIVVEIKESADKAEGDIVAYPARVKFRGFDNYSTEEGYKKISKYMRENADQLEKESKL